MDWVHCNQCYVQPGDIEIKKFFITNCGHIYCGECLQLNSSNECRICHIKYNTMPLTPKMSSEVEVYFHDPVVNIQKQVKILEFQQSHRIRLVSHNREKVRSCKNLEKENYTLREKLQLFKQENMSLREEIKRKKEELFDLTKKYEFLANGNPPRSSQSSSRHSFSQFMSNSSQRITPKSGYARSDVSEGNSQSKVKGSSSSNFFLMSESKSSSRKNDVLFTTPDVSRFSGNYRSNKISTPDLGTPPTLEAIIGEYSQKDPLQRKVKLPGSRSGPSPATKIGLHRLTLSRPTSTPNKENILTNKYLKYFK